MTRPRFGPFHGQLRPVLRPPGNDSALTGTQTIEIAALQLDRANPDARFVVSTLAEAEFLLEGFGWRPDNPNILLGTPLTPNAIPGLVTLMKRLGPTGVCVLADSLHQIPAITALHDACGHVVQVFLQVDMSTCYGFQTPMSHAEVPEHLITDLLVAEKRGVCRIVGLYSHMDLDVDGPEPVDAIWHLETELRALGFLAHRLQGHQLNRDPGRELTLSFGSAPTASALQLFCNETPLTQLLPVSTHEVINGLIRFRVALAGWQAQHWSWRFELRGGGYALWDPQHQATAAAWRRKVGLQTAAGFDMALTVLTELVSVSPRREPKEALVAAGSAALGREPCPYSRAYAVAARWDEDRGVGPEPAPGPLPSPGPEGRGGLLPSGWELTRIRPEYGILTLTYTPGAELLYAHPVGDDHIEYYPAPGGVGHRVRLWPNNAAVASAMYDYYVVVDGDIEDGERVVDVWPRCKGR